MKADPRLRHPERNDDEDPEAIAFLPETSSKLEARPRSLPGSSAARSSLSLFQVFHTWPLALGFIGVLLVSFLFENVSLSMHERQDEPARQRQCPGYVMPACLGVNHWVIVIGILVVSAAVWFFRVGHPKMSVKNAEHITRSLAWLLVLLFTSRHVLRVQVGDTLPSIKGAYVINMDHNVAGWERVRGELLASFNPEIVHRSPAVKRSEALTLKMSITASHIAALEAISKQEDTSLRDLHGRRKEWFLVFEDDVVLGHTLTKAWQHTTKREEGQGMFANSSDAVASRGEPAAAATSAGGGAAANVHDVVYKVLRKLPKRAQAVNLGACKGRLELARLFGRETERTGPAAGACSAFGLDSLTLLSSLLSRPLAMSVADLLTPLATASAHGGGDGSAAAGFTAAMAGNMSKTGGGGGGGGGGGV